MDHRDFDYAYIRNTIWALRARYPRVRVGVLGKSVMGRDIFVLETGRPEQPKMLYTAGFRGTDDVTPPLLLQFLDGWLAAAHNRREISGIDAQRAEQHSGMAIVPLLNPDGREIAKKGFHFGGDGGRLARLYGGRHACFTANARGVELLENFDADFSRRLQAAEAGIFGPGGGFPGRCAESEPESKLLADYCRRERFSHAIQLHMGDGTVFWRSRTDNTVRREKAEQMAHILAVSAGYALEAVTGPCSFGGFRNWFAEALNRPCADIMVKPLADGREQYERLEEMLALGAVM